MRPIDWLFAAGFAGILSLTGCQGELIDIIPRVKDASASLFDMTVDLGPPTFVRNIEPDIDNTNGALGSDPTVHCANTSACHQAPDSVNAPLLVYKPTSMTDLMANYMAFMNETTPSTPDQSPVLQNPGTPNSGHTGGYLFPMGGDTYNTWLTWISNGEPFQ